MVSQWYVMIRSHPVSLFLKDFRTSNIMIKLFNCCFVNGIKQYILIELGQNIGGHNLLTLFECQSNIFTLVLATTLTFQKWQIFIATWDFLLDSAKNRRLADVNAVGESILTLKEFHSKVCGNFIVELEISVEYEHCL